jgi:hypothetical protein
MKRMRALTPVALAACCLALAACGSDDDGGSTSADTTATTAAVDNTLSINTKESGPTVAIAVDGPQSAGLATITFRNDGRKPHDAQLIRVEGEHTQAEVLDTFDRANAGRALPDWFLAGGGAGETPPGGTASIVQRLEPGTYWVFDTVTADGEGEGKPNYRAGGVARIDVTGEDAGGEPAAADASVTAQDFRFSSDGLRTGELTVDFANDGRQIHHLLAFPLLPGRTVEDVRRALASQRAAPPLDFRNGVNTAAIEGGTEQQVTLDFRRSGRYVLICFISNREGGPPHALMGMVNEVDVE